MAQKTRLDPPSPETVAPVKINIDELVPNPRNPRAHPDEQIRRLSAALRRFGLVRPLLARKANKMMIGGHGVLQACKAIGMTEVAVVLWDVSQKAADAYMVADNRHAQLAVDDDDVLAELLREQGTEEERLAMGFDEPETAELLRKLDGAELMVQRILVDSTTVNDRFWVSIRGPLTHQAAMLDALKAAAEGLPDVEVFLGSIEVDA